MWASPSSSALNQRPDRPSVADLAQRPGDLIVDVRVPEQGNEDVETAAVPQLAKHVDCVVSVRPNLIPHPPARFCKVCSTPRDPLTDRPVASVRQDAPDGGQTARITKAREDERRIRPDVSIVVPQQRLQRHECSSVPVGREFLRDLELPPEHRCAVETFEQLLNGRIALARWRRTSENHRSSRRAWVSPASSRHLRRRRGVPHHRNRHHLEPGFCGAIGVLEYMPMGCPAGSLTSPMAPVPFGRSKGNPGTSVPPSSFALLQLA